MTMAWRRSMQQWPPTLQRRHAQRTEQLQRESPSLHRRAAEYLAFEELEPEHLRQKATRERSRWR